jgi:hypothetical protein
MSRPVVREKKKELRFEQKLCASSAFSMSLGVNLCLAIVHR